MSGLEVFSFLTKGTKKPRIIWYNFRSNFNYYKKTDLEIDGELHFVENVVNSIGQKKAPGSNVAGRANILVFPDLQAENIGYKIAQRLGGAEAVGPVVQGLKKPLIDLSRGCSVDDIFSTSSIAALMAE